MKDVADQQALERRDRRLDDGRGNRRRGAAGQGPSRAACSEGFAAQKGSLPFNS
jgi:hypothetical protein